MEGGEERLRHGGREGGGGGVGGVEGRQGSLASLRASLGMYRPVRIPMLPGKKAKAENSLTMRPALGSRIQPAPSQEGDTQQQTQMQIRPSSLPRFRSRGRLRTHIPTRPRPRQITRFHNPSRSHGDEACSSKTKMSTTSSKFLAGLYSLSHNNTLNARPRSHHSLNHNNSHNARPRIHLHPSVALRTFPKLNPPHHISSSSPSSSLGYLIAQTRPRTQTTREVTPSTCPAPTTPIIPAVVWGRGSRAARSGHR